MASHEAGPARSGSVTIRREPAREGPAEPGAERLASPEVAAMVAAWRRGERPLAETFLAARPDLRGEAAIRLIFEEFCLREELGLGPDPDDFLRRFPRWRDELEVLFDCHRLIESQTAPARFPEVGETFAGFDLLAELGRGAAGRVYLAKQASLADRPVVLKVTARGYDEHLSLARLQHMNIIPLYSELVLPERHQRVLCMPYLGGTTLDRFLEKARDRPPVRRTGSDLFEVIDKIQATHPVSMPSAGPFRHSLERSTYVRAICWIGACLADGLQYAHDRGLVHMDIKPSNVLITGDGQPMLLDFHLTGGPIDPRQPAPLRLGGTPEYASPEQIRAMEAVRAGRSGAPALDGRSDIYSLGLLLYETLGGALPAPGGADAPPLSSLNPEVSVGLSDIIRKCLARHPRDRYPHAAALADDLRRHVNDQPLRWVRNRSLAERWRKWRRRQPTALPRKLVAAVLLVVAIASAALLGAGYAQRVGDVEADRLEGRRFRESERYPEAVSVLRHGETLAAWTPAIPGLKRELDQELALAVRGQRADELHRLADLVRFRYGIDTPPAEEAQTLIARGREIWAARGELLRADPSGSTSKLDTRIRADLYDFAVVWADLRKRMAPDEEKDAADREASRVLDEAAELGGPSAAPDEPRTAFERKPGEPSRGTASSTDPSLAWAHYQRGKVYLRSREFAEAADEFKAALDLRPQDFWPNFYLGLAAYRLRRFDDAISAFNICVALAADNKNRAEGYYNRALALAAAGQNDRASQDYTHALELDASLTQAALNRGILAYRAGRLTDAEGDFHRALRDTPSGSRSMRATILYNLALVQLARNDTVAARASLGTAARDGHAEAASLLRRLDD